MLFNSFQFLFFFVLVWLLFFFLTRGTPRKVILLIASYYFYMCWSTRYIFVIWGITLIDYVAGLQIEKAERVGAPPSLPGPKPVLQFISFGHFQIFQLPHRLSPQREPSVWFAVRPAVAGDHLAGWTFLSHVSGDELHH